MVSFYALLYCIINFLSAYPAQGFRLERQHDKKVFQDKSVEARLEKANATASKSKSRVSLLKSAPPKKSFFVRENVTSGGHSWVESRSKISKEEAKSQAKSLMKAESKNDESKSDKDGAPKVPPLRAEAPVTSNAQTELTEVTKVPARTSGAGSKPASEVKEA